MTLCRVSTCRMSTIAREADGSRCRTYAGPEIGVASTKAFTCQLAALAVPRHSPPAKLPAAPYRREQEERRLVGALIEACRGHMAEIAVASEKRHRQALAREIANARDVLYLGRGINFPIALEGALKLKEISAISTPKATRRAS